jgi:hypothetical protein
VTRTRGERHRGGQSRADCASAGFGYDYGVCRTGRRQEADEPTDPEADKLVDLETHSTWNAYGVCLAKRLKSTQLKPLILEPEFWFAWSEFTRTQACTLRQMSVSLGSRPCLIRFERAELIFGEPAQGETQHDNSTRNE